MSGLHTKLSIFNKSSMHSIGDKTHHSWLCAEFLLSPDTNLCKSESAQLPIFTKGILFFPLATSGYAFIPWGWWLPGVSSVAFEYYTNKLIGTRL